MTRSCSRSTIASAVYACWVRVQVELQGKYSLERLRRVEQYTARTSPLRVAGLCLITPIPCALVTLLLDRIAIEPVRAGAAHSPRLWLRCLASLWLFTLLLLQQQRSLMLRPVFPKRLVVAVSTVVSAATTALIFELALCIGYPLPFTGAGGLVVWLVVTLVCVYLGSQLHASLSSSYEPINRHELHRCAVLLVCQLVPTGVYTLFNAAYVATTQRLQPLFLAALPLLKLAIKNAISFSLRDLDDLKPETVIFNIDIFHALFVACAMQMPSATGTASIVAVVGVDLMQFIMTLYDLYTITCEVEPIRAKLAVGSPLGAEISVASLLRVARFVAETDQSVKSSRSIRASCWQATAVTPLDNRRSVSRRERDRGSSNGTDFRPDTPRREFNSSPQMDLIRNGPTMETAASVTPTKPIAIWAPRKSSVRRSSLVRVISGLPPSSSALSQARHLLTAYRALNEADRLLLVQKTLQIMYVTEFAVLVEYTEVIMPLIHAVCVLVSYYSPNRDFFLFLQGVDATSLPLIVRNVLLYAALELVSLVALTVILWNHLGVSLAHQLAFVLDKQSVNVQCKLVSWVLFVIESSLVQLGSDYTLAFAWLRDGSEAHNLVSSP